MQVIQLIITTDQAQRLAELLGFVVLSTAPELAAISNALDNVGIFYPEDEETTLEYKIEVNHESSDSQQFFIEPMIVTKGR